MKQASRGTGANRAATRPQRIVAAGHPPETLGHDVNAHRTGVIRQADVHHEPSCMDHHARQPGHPDGVLWRTLPCPIPPGQRHKLQGVRLAGPEPLPPRPRPSSARSPAAAAFRSPGSASRSASPRRQDCHDRLRRHNPAGHRPARRAAYHGAARQHWRDQPVQGLRQAGNHADSHSSNHTRYREGGDLMTGVT